MLTALPLGLTVWAGFLLIGWRARRTGWLRAAGAYGVGVIVLVGFATAAPLDAEGKVEPGAWQTGVAAVVMVVLWIGGLVHALFANHRWLRWRAGTDR